jgi:UDP:flavonoid glycosyltransferase YjiC (YdhE family)
MSSKTVQSARVDDHPSSRQKSQVLRSAKIDDTPDGKLDLPGHVSADIAIIADFTSGDLAWRLAAETRIQAAAGYTTAFVHVPADRNAPRPIHPDLNACVLEGLARPVDPASQVVRARLALIRDPGTLLQQFLDGKTFPLPRVLADRVVSIASGRPAAEGGGANDQRTDSLVRSVFGAANIWAAETEGARSSLMQASLHVIDELWRPSFPRTEMIRARQRVRHTAAVVGSAGAQVFAWWSANADEMKLALGAGGQSLVRLLLSSMANGQTFPEDWEILATDEIGIGRFLRGLDFFVFCPTRRPESYPLLPIAMAMALGIPTILHPALRNIFGDGARYALPEEVPAIIRDLHGDEESFTKASERAAATDFFSAEVHMKRLRVLLGERNARQLRLQKAERPILFVSSNGVGLGHLTRQLAIARRLPSDSPPVFATMSQGFSVVEQCGFPVEYIPFATQARFDVANWDDWLAAQLGQIIDLHGAAALVFDGIRPFDGLIRTLRVHRNVSAVWVRRPMWRPDTLKEVLGAQRYFNLVIEPGETAAVNDQGATRDYRKAVMQVPPIRLLDEEELLDRKSAAARLGLDPTRPAVLIQLGAGTNRDIVALIDLALATLQAHPEVQPVIAEWKISTMPAELWPDVPRLRAFPLARYFAAFDFTISAAGYNSFHEILSFGMPSILLSNGNQPVDDQPQRASFAEERGAAIALPDSDPGNLQMAIETLMNERARWFLSANCARLRQPNGAVAAAEAIASTVYA